MTDKEWYDKGFWFGHHGYIWAKGLYQAFGTYPGNTRGSATDFDSIQRRGLDRITELEIVCNSGYRPDEWVSPQDDGSVDFEKLWAFIQEHSDADTDLSNPFVNSAICRKYKESLK